jgi:hypothetical protein
MVSCELECETNPVMSAFYTDFVERVAELPILRINYDSYTRLHRHGSTLIASPVHAGDEVWEGSIELRRLVDAGDYDKEKAQADLDGRSEARGPEPS